MAVRPKKIPEVPQKIPEVPRESRWPFVFNAGMIAQLLTVIGLTWLYAWINGKVPDAVEIARYERTGDGPWDHSAPLSALLDFVFLSATFTAVSGVIGFITTRNTKHRAFAVVSILISVAAFRYHFWLID